jgi:putative endonuclease
MPFRNGLRRIRAKLGGAALRVGHRLRPLGARFAFGRSRSLGQRGENAAARFLWWRGYTIVDRNCRTRQSEIDLVAVKKRTIVFVEVKTRSSADEGGPFEAVTFQKQRRLTRAALAYLKRHDLLEYPARFDVIGVTWPRNAFWPRIEHIPGAFAANEQWQMFS